MKQAHYLSERYRLWRDAATRATSGISRDQIYDTFVLQIAALRKQGGCLDAGSGIGLLCDRLIKTGQFRMVVGADFLSPHSTLKRIPWVRCDLHLPLPFLRGSFDMIVCSEVIEHLENPYEFTRNLRELLKHDGVLLLSTPNNESLRSYLSLALRGYYPDFGPSRYPTHLTPLLRIDLVRILTAAGFDRPTFYYTHSGAIPKTRITWQMLDMGLFLKGRWFSDNLVAQARPFIKTIMQRESVP